MIILTNQPFKANDTLIANGCLSKKCSKNFKTTGFKREDMHMKDSKRLASLLIVLSIDAFLIYSVETSITTHWRETIQCPLWSIFKRGRIAFQRTLRQGLFSAISLLLTCLKTFYQIIELQK